MSATLINKGLQTKIIGAPGGVRIFVTRDARRLQNSLSSKQKVELPPDLFGAPGGVRIPNLWFRRPTLYPIELQAHIFYKTKILYAVAFSLSIKK